MILIINILISMSVELCGIVVVRMRLIKGLVAKILVYKYHTCKVPKRLPSHFSNFGGQFFIFKKTNLQNIYSIEKRALKGRRTRTYFLPVQG